MLFRLLRWSSTNYRRPLKLDTTEIDEILRDGHPSEKVLLNPTRGPIPTHGTGGFDYNWLVANSHVAVWFRANKGHQFVVNMDVIQLRERAYSLVFLDGELVTYCGMVGDRSGNSPQHSFEPRTKKALVRLYERVRQRIDENEKKKVLAA